MKNRIYIALAMVLSLCSMRTAAQHTGSYDTTVTFMSAPRAVSIYVPPTYNPATAYRLMVCLHGLGDTCSNYRTALMTSLGWAANIPNTIFVCPEAAFRNADYYYPTGGEGIIQTAIDFAMETYHIDTANVVLQGFSLGGRAALRYGLDNYSVFKGLLLNTPAVQGVKEAINGGAYTFNYANASHIPVYITHGADDVIYTGPIDSMYLQMVLNDGKTYRKHFPGLAHAIPGIASILNFISFFDDPRSAGPDMDIVQPMIKKQNCVASVTPSCVIRNTGNVDLHSAKLTYGSGSATATFTWTGTLAPYQHAIVTLPPFVSPSGGRTLTVAVDTLEATVADTFTSNNANATTYSVQTTGLIVPIMEGFEATTFPPANWVTFGAGDVYAEWDRDDAVWKTGFASIYAFNTILLFDNAGRVNEIAAPLLDLTASTNPHLNFDLAFNYHHYAPPVATFDSTFADTLTVMVSTDCGDNFTTLYKKGGSELATFPDPILNATTLSAAFIDPGADNWRNEDVDLNAYKAFDKLIIKFSYKSSLGGSINIDNVRIGEYVVSVNEAATGKPALFPNPATDIVRITSPEAVTSVIISDITGRIVAQPAASGKDISVNTTDLVSGIYMFRISTAGGTNTEKVTVNH
ncbi:MAG: T9SS type A sorting domain-containing protein [Taibaiella sp.]|nr:T9SS type A sorting domain-containing protein [Taibaiella sp.]